MNRIYDENKDRLMMEEQAATNRLLTAFAERTVLSGGIATRAYCPGILKAADAVQRRHDRHNPGEGT